MAGTSITKPARKRITAAIALASSAISSLQVSAGSYTTELSGAIVYRQSWVYGVPGAASPSAPYYQQPRLALFFGGPGWATKLTVSINSDTGEITDFEEQATAGFITGNGSDIAGLYPPGVSWKSGQDFPMPNCGVTSANPGETGTIVYTCPVDPLPGSSEVVDFNASGYQCLTTHPSSTNYHGHNGCANHNAGVSFPGGIPTINPPEFTNGAHIAVPADSGLSPATTTNPAFYATNDPEQYFNGAVVRSFSVNENPSVNDVSEGVVFRIYHNGTFSNADFSVTQVRFFNQTKANIEVAGGALPPGTFEFYTQSEYDAVISQSYVASEDDLGKPVPAMGAFGLTTLFMGLIGIAGRFRKISNENHSN